MLYKNGRAIPLDPDFVESVLNDYIKFLRELLDNANDTDKTVGDLFSRMQLSQKLVSTRNLPTHTNDVFKKRKDLYFYVVTSSSHKLFNSAFATSSYVKLRIGTQCAVYVLKDFINFCDNSSNARNTVTSRHSMLYLRSLLAHEITHTLDYGIREKAKNAEEAQQLLYAGAKLTDKQWSEYFNSPTEVRARISEWIEKLRNDKPDDLGKWLKNNFCWTDDFNDLRKAWRYLTTENKKKVYRALYEEFANPQKKADTGVSAKYLRSCMFITDTPIGDMSKWAMRELLGVERKVSADDLREKMNEKYWYYTPRPRSRRVAKNPPTKGYEYVGVGSFAVAYMYPNKNTVEIILKENDYQLVDWSREAMILARIIAPANAKKHLPEISRLRIDRDNNGDLEFVYKMPAYDHITKFTQVDEVEASLASIDESGVAKSTLEKALKSIMDACKRLKQPFNDDIVFGNLGLSKDGTIILRDPIFINASAEGLEKRWKSFGIKAVAK